ncbi:MAG: ParB/RepB/Spo0J family partition protein [Bdellovibrionia bacterium]
MSSFDMNNQKKNRLGRGLESLLGSAIEESNSPKAETVPAADQVTWLRLDQLRRNPKQPRQVFDAEKLKELAASIKEKGILQPIVARRTESSQFEIIAGERRWRASQLAGLEKVPVLIKDSTDQDVLELALIENLQRDDLNPIEEAEAFQRLAKDFMLTQSEIAQKVGKERATVANSMRLLELGPNVRDMLSRREISTGHAKVLLGLGDMLRQEEFAKQVVAGQLSVRATEKLISSQKEPSLKKPALQPLNLNISEKLVSRIAEELQKTLGTKVTIDYKDKKGKLSIHFYSDEELSQVVEKLKTL